MSVRLDHIVILVDDLQRAVGDHRRRGFTVEPGGVHEGGASENALVLFADGTYLELLALRAPGPAHPDEIVAFAVCPDDLDEALAGARRRGLTVAPVGPEHHANRALGLASVAVAVADVAAARARYLAWLGEVPGPVRLLGLDAAHPRPGPCGFALI